MVKIITDTTSCLENEFAARHAIPVIPQIVTFGEESFYEEVELSHAGFMKRLRASSQLPKTAAPPPDLFVREFERLVPQGEPILCIHPSAEVSGTVRSATVAARDFPNADIRVIDTRTVASPLGSMVKIAAAMAQGGSTADDIEKTLQGMIPKCRVYFLVATLEYLAKGGRIGGAAALLGSVLQVKPILAIRDGKVDTKERERTQKKAVARLIDIIVEQYPSVGDAHLTLLHADAPNEIQAIADELRRRLNLAEIQAYNMPPAIITHGGPGILGAAFFTDHNFR